MFRIFKIKSDDADVVARPVSTTQAPPVPTAQSEKVSDNASLDLLTTLSKANGISSVQQGARLAVMGELLGSVVTHLPDAMRADIAKSFRGRVEYLMSLSDDTPLPETYHSALLSEVNRYLKALL